VMTVDDKAACASNDCRLTRPLTRSQAQEPSSQKPQSGSHVMVGWREKDGAGEMTRSDAQVCNGGLP
jgi:hypothetical protein